MSSNTTQAGSDRATRKQPRPVGIFTADGLTPVGLTGEDVTSVELESGLSHLLTIKEGKPVKVQVMAFIVEIHKAESTDEGGKQS